MYFMFYNAKKINKKLNNWNVSNVIIMYSMFNNAISFNKNIINWDILNVIVMVYMFNNKTTFNQNISNWNITNFTNSNNMFFFNSLIPFHKIKTTLFFNKPYKNI